MTEPVLLPYQQRWVENKASVKVWEKSRRIGASWCTAAEAVLCAALGVGGMDCWYVGYNYDMAKEFIDDASMWARAFDVAASDVEQSVVTDDRGDILTYEIRLSSGHVVKALSSRPTNLRGKAGFAVIDEAAFHDDLPGLLKAALAFLVWGGRVAILSTHDGHDSAFARLCDDVRSGKLHGYYLQRTTLDDALADGLYRRICTVLGKTWSADAERQWRQELVDQYAEGADEELFCVPRHDQAGLLYQFNASLNTFDGKLDPSINWQTVLGVDIGYNDETALVECSYHKASPKCYLHSMYAAKGMIVADVAAEIAARRSKRWYTAIVGDTGGGSKMAVEELCQRYKIPITAADKRDKRSHIGLVNSDLRQGLMMVEAGSPWIDQAGKVVWDKHHQREAEGQRCDILDAALYAYMGCYAYTHKPVQQRDELAEMKARALERGAETAAKMNRNDPRKLLRYDNRAPLGRG